jgi:hypothetical protein
MISASREMWRLNLSNATFVRPELHHGGAPNWISAILKLVTQMLDVLARYKLVHGRPPGV